MEKEITKGVIAKLENGVVSVEADLKVLGWEVSGYGNSAAVKALFAFFAFNSAKFFFACNSAFFFFI